MSRSWAAVALLVVCGACSAQRLPDVVLITLDATRADRLGAYGYPRGITPELDAFARDALLFERAWSTAPWTLPSHASIFVGKNPTSHGAHFNARAGKVALSEAIDPRRAPRDAAAASLIRANRLGEDQETLAELLSARGYATAAFSGGPWLTPGFGLLQGYAHQRAEAADLHGRPADELTDAAMRWLERVPEDRPLHLLVNYFDPHAPHEPPPGFDDLPGARVPQTMNEFQVISGGGLPASERASWVDRYDGEIRFMDHHLGRLLRKLRALGRYEGALIIVVADHGETLGEHGLVGHARWLYEEVLRVPLLIHLPGGRDAGEVHAGPVSLVDLLPLVAAEVGFAPPEGVEGVPLGQRVLVLAESHPDRLSVETYGERFDRDLFAAVRWPWKLVLDSSGAARLYDLDADSGERHNLVGAPQERILRDELARARAALQAPTGD